MIGDSPSWIQAKTAGDAAELALAAWWRERGFDVHKSIGQADHDLRVTLDVEVKRDLRAATTGNLAIEVGYGGAPSGIVTSRAAYWQVVTGAEAFLIRADRLRALAMDERWREVAAGDGHKARVRLVPIDEVRRRAEQVIKLEGAP